MENSPPGTPPASRIALPNSGLPSRAYAPTPWLTNPHLQTVWGRLFGKRRPLPFVREDWSTPDDDTLTLLRLKGRNDLSPSFLLLHGLEGSENSHYVAGTLGRAFEQGWQANLLLFRTCNGRLNKQIRSYHSGETSDLEFVVQRLLAERPRSDLFVAGVSLGGNVLLKWLGERSINVNQRVRGAAAVSVPYDLARASRHIDQGVSKIYSARFLRSLKAKALKKIARHANVASAARVKEASTLWAFDDAFTAPVHGFNGAADYYQKSSSIHFLQSIAVPALLLSSHDDPFIPPGLLYEVEEKARENPQLQPEFLEFGGHVGFVEGSLPWRLSSYAERRIVEFAGACLGMSRSQNAR